MEEADDQWMMIRMVGGWVFLLALAHPGSPGQRAVKRLLLLLLLLWMIHAIFFRYWPSMDSPPFKSVKAISTLNACLIDHIWLLISIPQQLCTSLELFPRYVWQDICWKSQTFPITRVFCTPLRVTLTKFCCNIWCKLKWRGHWASE